MMKVASIAKQCFFSCYAVKLHSLYQSPDKAVYFLSLHFSSKWVKALIKVLKMSALTTVKVIDLLRYIHNL